MTKQEVENFQQDAFDFADAYYFEESLSEYDADELSKDIESFDFMQHINQAIFDKYYDDFSVKLLDTQYRKEFFIFKCNIDISGKQSFIDLFLNSLEDVDDLNLFAGNYNLYKGDLLSNYYDKLPADFETFTNHLIENDFEGNDNLYLNMCVQLFMHSIDDEQYGTLDTFWKGFEDQDVLNEALFYIA